MFSASVAPTAPTLLSQHGLEPLRWNTRSRSLAPRHLRPTFVGESGAKDSRPQLNELVAAARKRLKSSGSGTGQ